MKVLTNIQNVVVKTIQNNWEEAYNFVLKLKQTKSNIEKVQ